MNIVTNKKFDRQYQNQPKKIRKKFDEKIILFVEDIRHSSLNVHKLTGKYKGLWSFNVTGDVRVVFDMEQKDVIILVVIGTHSQLYK